MTGREDSERWREPSLNKFYSNIDLLILKEKLMIHKYNNITCSIGIKNSEPEVYILLLAMKGRMGDSYWEKKTNLLEFRRLLQASSEFFKAAIIYIFVLWLS